MILPFNVYDGKEKRPCTYSDLFVIMNFGLDYRVWSLQRKWWFFRLEENQFVLAIVYANLQAMMDLANIYPQAHYISVVDRYRIDLVECKELHVWKSNPLIALLFL